MNRLYYGDNLEVLRKYIADESVDLVYLDPPFNSKADYNILYKEQNGSQSASQIKAFSDFWHWDQEAQRTFEDLVGNPAYPSDLKKLIISIRDFLGNNDMSAYLVMMAVRLVELRRVLKSKGSVYLHCDPTASHYLKIVMDTIFGPENFINEISWKRSAAHSDSKQGSKHFGRIHDIILFYVKTSDYQWNQQYSPHDSEYVNTFYKHIEEGTGRRYQLDNLTGPGGAAKGNPRYELMGVTRYWRYTKEKMNELVKEGRIIQTHPGSVPRYKRYLDEMPGVSLQDWWGDIPTISSQSGERLGFPTQKPLPLLERIILGSSNVGDVVLDPFCGCGTALDAAEKLHRQWIGIDITHLAINVIKKRLRERYPDVKFEVIGEPKDLEGARELAKQDRYQFQWWACSLIDAAPYENKKRGADTGIDCVLYNPVKGTSKTYYGIVQVKSGNVNSGQVRDFKGTMEREKADYGIFLTLEDPTEPMNKEAVVAGHIRTEWNASIPKVQVLTIKELLEGRQPEFPFPPDNYNTATRGKRILPQTEEKQTMLSSGDQNEEK
ncbi:MAG: restriction endonuclease [Candidatus Thermoplasmatota archaeon]|nr:restriction endonuclease [Candidatus Thermoplasmatota archaeon]